LNVTDLGATCCLLEYNEIEGFIASSDYSRKRIRSVKKLMRVGKQEVLQVLRVDEEKGYVDLSKKLLTPKDIELCSERFEKAKIVNGILRRLAEMRKEPVKVRRMRMCQSVSLSLSVGSVRAVWMGSVRGRGRPRLRRAAELAAGRRPADKVQGATSVLSWFS
jgi:predicted RNA-binding protein with RPS1 domain